MSKQIGISKKTKILFDNGDRMKSEDIWNKYAGKIMGSEDTGEVSYPKEKLYVKCLDTNINKLTVSYINKMYRSKVDGEIYKLTLDDNTYIYITLNKKILSDKGWLEKIKKNCFVCGCKIIEGKKKQIIKKDNDDPVDDEIEFTYNSCYKFIKKIKKIKYTGFVYDFEVAKYTNYTANGVTCSIKN